MNKCHVCGIFVNDNVESCPLCHTVLSKTSHESEVVNKYPDIKHQKKVMNLIKNAFLFFCITCGAICIFVNYMFAFKPPWSVIVVVCLAYAYLMLVIMTSKYSGYRKRIFQGIFLGVIGTLLIDIAFGFKRWSVNFVLPGALCLLNLVLICLMIANRRNWQSYMALQIMMLLIGLIPLVGIKFGLVTHPLTSEIAFLSCLLVFIGTIVFGGRTASQELKRRFHI